VVNLFWSSAGIYPVGTGISPFDFEARVKSAAKAGFKGFSFWHTDLEHILTGRSLGEVKRILDDNGLSTFEVEFIGTGSSRVRARRPRTSGSGGCLRCRSFSMLIM
jgi:sugar phosphate isomerase/epimerase